MTWSSASRDWSPISLTTHTSDRSSAGTLIALQTVNSLSTVWNTSLRETTVRIHCTAASRVSRRYSGMLTAPRVGMLLLAILGTRPETANEIYADRPTRE